MNLRTVELAHDLKMPIQLIYSCVQLLEMELPVDSKAEGYLRMLMQSANQLQNMVTRALDDGADRSDVLHLECRDIVAEVRGIVNQASLFAGEKGIDVSFASNAAEFHMKTDGEKIGRILQNLLSNALRFTPEAGKVSVCVHVLGDAVEISVSDSGCGVPDCERIFERGYTTGGHGHGLAIVREYARQLRGGIAVHPNEGGGSCFVLRLPVLS